MSEILNVIQNASPALAAAIIGLIYAVRKLRELNGGRIFHPAFDGTWGDEDNFLADELGYSGFRIGYSTRVRLAGSFSSCDDKQKFDGFTANFINRIRLRRDLLGAPA